MTPTTLTLVRWLADAEKKVAAPPRTSSALPNGVSTESSATEPTTRTDIRLYPVWKVASQLHPLRRGNTEDSHPVPQHYLCSPRKRKSRARHILGLLEDVMLVIPNVGDPRRLQQVGRYPVRLQRFRRALDQRRKIEQGLDQLLLLGLGEHFVRHVFTGDRLRVDLADTKDSTHA